MTVVTLGLRQEHQMSVLTDTWGRQCKLKNVLRVVNVVDRGGVLPAPHGDLGRGGGPLAE